MTRALLIVLAACSACVGPRPPVPQSATVAAPQAWREAIDITAALDPAWWRAFGDPVLEALVTQALAGNADIAIAAARVEAARAQFHLARAERRPEVDLAASGGRDRAVNPFGNDVSQWASQGQVEISYDLDLFGRLLNADAAARAQLLASEAARDNVRLAIASSVASGYITLRALDARLIVLQETLEARRATLALARRRAAAGYSPVLEPSQAETEFEAAAQLIPATQLAIQRQENGLALLLGTAPDEIARGAALEAIHLPSAAPLLPSALLRRRPDIAAAEQRLVAADRSLDAVRAALLPDIQLNPSGGYVASNLLATSPLGVFSLGASILAPLSDSGRLAARQDAAAAERDAAAFAYRQSALAAFREVEDALAAIDRGEAQEQVLARQRNAASNLLTLASRRFEAGYSPFLEQIDAERGLLATELSLVQTRADRLVAAVALYQALGGGWSEGQGSRAGESPAGPDG